MAIQISIGSRAGGEAGELDNSLFHGTSVAMAKSLLAAPYLDLDKASAAKIDGPPGFFLAASHVDAEYFALRRAPGAVLRYRLAATALADLIGAGAILQAMAGDPPYFEGPELWIPPTAFDTFNVLLDGGSIDVTA